MHPPYVALYASDFLADITTLGNTELGIYWRLLLVYYQSRRPLPQDRDKLLRTAMASSPEEIRSLDVVLEQFFLPGTYGEDNVRVYRHARADKEIDAATSRWEAAHGRAVKAAKARWEKEECSSNAQALHKQSLSNANQNLKQQGSSSTVVDGSKVSTKAHIVDSGKESPEPPLVGQARLIISHLNLKANRTYRPGPANVRLIVARLKEGATPAECLAVIEHKVRDWRYDPEMVRYLRPATLFNALKFAQYLGELPHAQNADVR